MMCNWYVIWPKGIDRHDCDYMTYYGKIYPLRKILGGATVTIGMPNGNNSFLVVLNIMMYMMNRGKS